MDVQPHDDDDVQPAVTAVVTIDVSDIPLPDDVEPAGTVVVATGVPAVPLPGDVKPAVTAVVATGVPVVPLPGDVKPAVTAVVATGVPAVPLPDDVKPAGTVVVATGVPAVPLTDDDDDVKLAVTAVVATGVPAVPLPDDDDDDVKPAVIAVMATGVPAVPLPDDDDIKPAVIAVVATGVPDIPLPDDDNGDDKPACTAVIAAAAAVAVATVAPAVQLPANNDDDDAVIAVAEVIDDEPQQTTRSTENLVAPGEPPKHNACRSCNPVIIGSSYTMQVNFLDDNVGSGLRNGMITVFVAGEMAGVGMLTAPWAVANMGWMGFVLLLAIGLAIAYSGKCLGACWMILEERYYECRQYPIISQYATIAKYAIGYRASILAKVGVNFTLFGAATVYLMLIAQSVQRLFMDICPEINFCTWLFVLAIVLGALMFVKSPKDVRLVAGSVLLSTMAACYVIIVQILHNLRSNDGQMAIPQKGLDANQLLLSFGTLMFSFGGAIAFPAIQNNVFKRNEYSRSVLVSFMILGILFGTIVVGGYVVYGEHVQPNILMSLEDSWLSYAAIVLMIIHLVLGFLVIIDPVSQNLVKCFDDTSVIGFQRFVVRVFLVTFMIIFGISMQEFSNLIALMGSSMVTLGMVVMPSIFYLSLCSKNNCNWPDRSLSWKSKICPYIIIVVGLTLSLASTYAAVERIVGTETILQSCYLPWLYPQY